MKHSSSDKTEAQLIKFFQKVIRNAAFNYYMRESNQSERQWRDDQFLFSIKDSVDIETESLSQISIGKHFLMINNEKLNEVISSLNMREQQLLLEKHVHEKTDQEIAEILGISRQGVTNFKKRLYRKIEKKLDDLE